MKCIVTYYMRVQWDFKLSFQFTNCQTQKHFYKHLFEERNMLSYFSASPSLIGFWNKTVSNSSTPISFWPNSGCVMPLGLLSKRVLLPGMLEKTPAHINPCVLCPRERPPFWVSPEGRWWVAKDVWKELIQWVERSSLKRTLLWYFWRAFEYRNDSLCSEA